MTFPHRTPFRGDEEPMTIFVAVPKQYEDAQRLCREIEGHGHTVYHSGFSAAREGAEGASVVNNFPEIAKSDVLYAITPGGGVDPTVLIQMTYAYGMGIEIISSEPVSEDAARTLVAKAAAAPIFLADLEADQRRRDDRSLSARGKRIGAAFCGLLAASLLPLVLVLANTWRIRHYSLAQGDGGDMLYAWRGFAGYFSLSVLGWLLVGVPFAALVPSAFVRKRAWPARVLIGALLGPAALYLVFALFYGAVFSRIGVVRFWPAWLMAAAISTVAFVVYAVVLDRQPPARLRAKRLRQG